VADSLALGPSSDARDPSSTTEEEKKGAIATKLPHFRTGSRARWFEDCMLKHDMPLTNVSASPLGRVPVFNQDNLTPRDRGRDHTVLPMVLKVLEVSPVITRTLRTLRGVSSPSESPSRTT
jgi:hypothetical protein